MGYGRLAWIPAFQALTLDATHYLVSPDTSFGDPLTSDFHAACYFYPDSTISDPGNDRCILSKWDGNLASDSGWRLYYNPTSGYIAAEVNDGDASSLVLQSSNGLVIADSWNLAVLELQRGRLTAEIYLNGVLAKGGAGNGISGNITNSSRFAVGDVLSGGSKGYVGWVMVGYGAYDGYLAHTTWAMEEYYRVAYGDRELRSGNLIPNAYSWSFQGSLESNPYGSSGSTKKLVCETTGVPTYFFGGNPYGITFDFVHNPRRGRQDGFVALDSSVRTLDGSMYYYDGGTKFQTRLEFSCQLKQKIALECAFKSKVMMYYYPDFSGMPFTNAPGGSPIYYHTYIVNPPIFKQVHNSWWEVSLDLEEK